MFVRNRRSRRWYRTVYLRSDHWKAVRAWALVVADGKCAVCGSLWSSRNPLDVHHLSYRRLYHEHPEDVEVLCRSCHEKVTPKARRGDMFRRWVGSSRSVPVRW